VVVAACATSKGASARLEPVSPRAARLLLFFDAPARSIGSVTLDVRIVAEDGTPVGATQIPFARR
jgi:hypothetical protein